MTVRTTLDKAGRVVIPKPLREQLQLDAGDELELISDDQQISIRPIRVSPPLRKKQGIWVYRTGEPLTAAEVSETLDRVRREREQF